MDKIKLTTFLESSFLKELLIIDSVTDISFNGVSIYYLDNELGRRKSSIEINNQTAKDFIRQIANLSEKQFSYQSPTLDISFGRYRISAIHDSIARFNNEPVVNFSIRIASAKPRITKESSFLSPELLDLFTVLMSSNMSIVIGGLTGTGKTEFQKFLISLIPENSRLIIIDNVLELDNIPSINSLDVNFWQINDSNESSSIQILVKNALRSNPDWLIVAESRGSEMLDVLNSSLTGHPIITTIHALDIESMPSRMARMVMMNDKKMDFDDVLKDIYHNIKIYVHLKREINEKGEVKRFISSIGCTYNNELVKIFSKDTNYFGKFPVEYKRYLNKSSYTELFKKTFLTE